MEKETEFQATDCIVFKKNKDAFGELSNMATCYPLLVNDIPVKTVEALYQLCRFPNRIDIQEEIVNCPSPMTVKIKSRKYKQFTREDWFSFREDIMWWCLRIKLAQHPQRFGELLESTGNKIIVEDGGRDRFWGAQRTKENPNLLIGINKVGFQLMQLREFYRENKNSKSLFDIKSPTIPQFILYGDPIRDFKQ